MNKKLITKKQLLKKIAVITKMAIYINAETKANVFVNFSGHVNEIEVTIYNNGWKSKIDYDYCKKTYIYDDYNINNYETFDGEIIDCDYERSIDLTMKALEEIQEKLIEIASINNLDILSFIAESEE